MQWCLDNVCHVTDDNVKRKISAFRTSVLLFINTVTHLAVLVIDWNPGTFYIWLLLFFNIHGYAQLSSSIYLRYDSILLAVLGFFGVGQVGSLIKIWRHMENNQQYRQCVIHLLSVHFPLRVSVHLYVHSILTH